MTNPLHTLSAEGVAVWLDDISRDRLRSGNLQELITDRSLVGVTSNPTIFDKALKESDAYDDQLRDLAARNVSVDEAVRFITGYDIRWAADILRPTYESTGRIDGRVSLEVDPRLARDTERTAAEARALWWMVDRPNVFIKIPATAEGLPAITRALAEGVNVNVTLIFSLDSYRGVMDAFMAGLEQARENGHDISRIQSVASFFVSRVDAEVDKRLEKIGTDEANALMGRAAIANARLAYEAYEQAFATDRWKALADAGATPQRPLWASTGVKDPAYDDTRYIDQLVAPGTVNTMPEATLEAAADHAKITGDTVRGAYEQARQDLEAVASLGIDYDDVTATLENEGVDKFAKSWEGLLGRVSEQLKAHS
ncbi:transaldolase [Streptomonospora alba]|uniref:Transaldolase n=1 Tax=Streptomonospora alba TaxID=183763 RepID=A0A0C2JKH8_9ACTN|nr:transaldolase [Streptomonospora alba]KIH99450.1 transaldolase [Streptomonospora alba]